MTVAVPTTATATVLKNGRLDAVVKVTGAQAATITLASLQRSDETYSTGVVDIHAMYWSTTGSNLIGIERNSIVEYYLTNTDHWIFDQAFADQTNNTYDITVDLGAGGGSVILVLRKTSGYSQTINDQTPVG